MGRSAWSSYNGDGNEPASSGPDGAARQAVCQLLLRAALMPVLPAVRVPRAHLRVPRARRQLAVGPLNFVLYSTLAGCTVHVL